MSGEAMFLLSETPVFFILLLVRNLGRVASPCWLGFPNFV